HDGADQDRNLDQAVDAGEQSYRNQRSTKNVCEDNVMSQCRTGEIDVQAGRSHFKVMHVRDEVQTFVGNEDSQSHPENVKKSGSVGVSPFFDVPDDTHKPMVLYIQSLQIFSGDCKGRRRINKTTGIAAGRPYWVQMMSKRSSSCGD